MNDRDIDDVLRRASGAPQELDPALLDRISGAIGSRLHPVRPLPPPWVLSCGLLLICAFVALAGAGSLGFRGIGKMSFAQIAVIFPALGMFTWIAAMASAREMTPGSARRLPPAWLPVVGSLALAALFAALFDDYRVHRFVPRGLACLSTGLLHAAVAGAGSWLLLRRGFAVDPVAAGLVTGTLASLAGVAMLALHCPNFEAPHVLVWHTAVVPSSGLAGAFLGWAASRMPRRLPPPRADGA